MISADYALSVLKRYPNGIWIRKFARELGVCPATACNYIYGYVDSSGRRKRGILQDFVVIEKIGDGAVTIIRPKQST